MYEQVRDAQVKKLGADHPYTLTTLNNLAVAYQAAGKLTEAIACSSRSATPVKTARGRPPGHPHHAYNLAAAYQAAGKLPEAIALFEQVRDAQVKKLGADHPDTLTTLNNLAVAYWASKQLDKSVPLFEDVLKREEAKLGRQHPEYAADGGQPRGQLQGCRPADRGDPAARRGLPRQPQVPDPSLGWCSTARRLREGRPVGRGREAGPGTSGRRP